MITFFKKLDFRSYTFSSNKIILFSCLFIVLVYNQRFWGTLFSVVEPFQLTDILFLFSVMLVIFSVSYLLLSLFCFRRLLKPTITIIFMLSSITAYYIESYGIIFNTPMIQNIFETDVNEALELLDISILLYTFFYGVLPSAIIWSVKIHRTSISKEIVNRAVSIILIFILTSIGGYSTYKNFTFVFRNNPSLTSLINPWASINSVYKYADKKLTSEKKFNVLFSDATRQPDSKRKKKKLFIMIVGETARANNFHINGYKRNTTPNIEKENIINFKHVSACGTSTAISLPCMFSHLKHENIDVEKAENSSNLLDALRNAGINVLWRENNSGCKGICKRVKTESIAQFNIDSFCSKGRCFDEALLNKLDKHINTTKNDVFIVLHQQGSHGPAYFKRYPEAFATFKPECRTSTVHKCTNEEVVNAYDNTILYTDYFLSKVISYLKDQTDLFDTAMLYVSDHGESLGENNVYLHGLPYFIAPSYQTQVPLIMWLSDSFATTEKVSVSCLQDKTNEPISHDNLLHSVLGIMNVSTSLYSKQYDVFSSCKKSTYHQLVNKK
ncbi:MAG: phosphoethanolamine--lipid A transferase [Woeseiaceae bacterium]